MIIKSKKSTVAWKTEGLTMIRATAIVTAMFMMQKSKKKIIPIGTTDRTVTSTITQNTGMFTGNSIPPQFECGMLTAIFTFTGAIITATITELAMYGLNFPEMSFLLTCLSGLNGSVTEIWYITGTATCTSNVVNMATARRRGSEFNYQRTFKRLIGVKPRYK